MDLIDKEHELVLSLAHTLNTHDSTSLSFLIHLPIEPLTSSQTMLNQEIGALKVVI
jgi:hypothetical protein